MKFRVLLLTLGLVIQTILAETESTRQQINENSIMLIQALMNLPDEYIGGVPREQRGAFVNLVSHYGDIDFANGFFRLGGDGARAHDTPASRFFEIKLIPRDEGRPLCVIAQQSGSKMPLSIISFGPYWRWTDVTNQFCPDNLELNDSLSFSLSRNDNHQVVACQTEKFTADGRDFFRRGPMLGRLVWESDHFSFIEFNYTNYFRTAILEVPPKYLADIPQNRRAALLERIEKDAERLDVANGWMHYYSDSSELPATSMIWAKVLRRSRGEPYLFVHMAKPFAGSQSPGNNQTYVLRRDGEKWVEVKNILDSQKIDLTGHFRTRRDDIIETGSWKEIDRRDGKGKAWVFGTRKTDLKWNHRYFYLSKAASETFTQ